MELVELDLADHEQAEHYWRVRETALSAGRPRYQPTRLEDFLELLALPDETYRRRVIAVSAQHSMMGAAVELTPTDVQSQDVWVFPFVPPHYRGEGIGRMLIEELIRHAQDAERTRMLSAVEFAGDNLAEASRHPYVHFARSHGFEIGRRLIRWELTLPVDPSIRASFDQAAYPRLEGYRLAIFEGLPPPQWRDMLWALHAVSDDHDMARELAVQPDRTSSDPETTATMWLGQGHAILTAIAVGPQDDLVGLCTVRIPPKPESAAILQGATYVDEAHRRRRLAPMLLLALSTWIDTHAPQRKHLHNTTVEIDRKMASLSRALGYRPIETMLRVSRRIVKEIPPEEESASQS
ncbi:hypothetical protein KEM60_00745 [Austwickia sp. TVS 96-490-7B]|uniref:GNAT family N-acetyltransferase n=1 Tax=Austwickia sp. TVS 96-490-7B TaxID=2830843 RepID=UPI001C565A22|nr:GNAT family N-acetyltransferase [Austwickia sp. TVS 96-490-7B]MBW3084557.1 hypothetical protein [Austwickia sp. TVS 96-490-7B]